MLQSNHRRQFQTNRYCAALTPDYAPSPAKWLRPSGCRGCRARGFEWSVRQARVDRSSDCDNCNGLRSSMSSSVIRLAIAVASHPGLRCAPSGLHLTQLHRMKFTHEHAHIFAVVNRATTRCTPPSLKAASSRVENSLALPTREPWAPYDFAYATKSGLPKSSPKSENPSTSCFHRIIP